MKLLARKSLPICLLILLLFGIMPPHAHAEAVAVAASPKRILIFPFTIYAPQDMQYLSKATQEMLSSRLAQSAQFEIIRETTAVQDTADVSTRLHETGADLAVAGSLTIFGQEVSTDVEVIEAGQPKPFMVFHEYGRTEEGVLIHIQKLAEQILQDMPPAFADEEKSPASHPGQNGNPPTDGPWRSKNLDYGILGLAAGDVTGDGRRELVTAAEDFVNIYAFKDGELVQMDTLNQKNGLRIISVDVADADGDQRAEIYVTRIRKDGGLNSAILEWNGRKLNSVAEGLDWFFRVQTVDHGALPVLLGQRQWALHGTAANDEKRLFAPGVRRLAWQSGIIVPGETVDLPQDTNLYGFVCGDVMGNGNKQTLRYIRRDMLQLLNSEGAEEWRSTRPYGGGAVYLNIQPARIQEEEETGRYYLPQRIRLICDNARRKCLVLVSQNEEAGGRLFKRFRKFTGGHMEILSWDGVALKTAWQTDPMAGHISDFTLVDMDHDGRKDLIYVVVSGSGSFSFGKQASRIYLQTDLPIF